MGAEGTVLLNTARHLREIHVLLQDKIYIKTLVGAIGKNSIKTTRTETCFCLYEEGRSEAAMEGVCFFNFLCLTRWVHTAQSHYRRPRHEMLIINKLQLCIQNPTKYEEN